MALSAEKGKEPNESDWIILHKWSPTINYLIKSQKQKLFGRYDLLEVLQRKAMALRVKFPTAMGI